LWVEAFRRFRKHRLATVGGALLMFMVVAVLAGPLVYRVPIDEIDFRAKLQGPSRAHPLGTDDLGQDLLARMLYGGRISLAVGVAAMLVAISLGTLVGAVSGQLGGGTDNALMRVTDLFLSLPQLPLLLLVVYLFRDALKVAVGPEAGVFVLIVAVIGGLRWMPVARLVRAQFLSLREKEFVEAARGLGVPSLRQVVRHILPNAIGPVIVAASLDVAAAIIAESSLSSRPTSRPGAGSSSTRRTTSTSRPTGRSFPARRSS
jgi:peptide/nickel transport system permease protein